MKKDIDIEISIDYTPCSEEDAFQLLEEYLIVVKEWEEYER